MSRLLGFVFVVGALAAVPTAFAAFPAPYPAQGGNGVLGKNGTVRYVAYRAGDSTRIVARRVNDGSVVRSAMLPGSYGVPVIANRRNGEGLLHDGSAFVLQSTGTKSTTSFEVMSSALVPRAGFTLDGTFSYDALSPDGGVLYLIQHQSLEDIQHYVVRAYDMSTHRLRAGQIADKTQRGWVMQGWPAARTTSADGRWVYTLYANPGGNPFVHALDTVRGVAHCVGIRPPSSDQSVLFQFTLELKGGKLLVRAANRALYRTIDRTTWKVSAR